MTTYIKNNTTNNKKYVFVQKNTHTHTFKKLHLAWEKKTS